MPRREQIHPVAQQISPDRFKVGSFFRLPASQLRLDNLPGPLRVPDITANGEPALVEFAPVVINRLANARIPRVGEVLVASLSRWVEFQRTGIDKQASEMAFVNDGSGFAVANPGELLVPGTLTGVRIEGEYPVAYVADPERIEEEEERLREMLSDELYGDHLLLERTKNLAGRYLIPPPTIFEPGHRPYIF